MFHDKVTVREALSHSLNVPAVDLLVVASELVIRERERLTAEALQLSAGQKVKRYVPPRTTAAPAASSASR